jgi:hypothetical protein
LEIRRALGPGLAPSLQPQPPEALTLLRRERHPVRLIRLFRLLHLFHLCDLSRL